ncbi:MAG: dephospho-CoA kinase [Candidatus Syntrophosphaera sp.]
MESEPIRIGITGNIGSGKSSFCEMLMDRGCKVIFADKIAQEQLETPDSIKQITKRWGKDILREGKPDRKKIASIVFNRKTELDFLNSVIHPKTLNELQNISDNSSERFLFFEIPLLFEAGMQRCFDYIILVKADRGKRLTRLLKSGQESPSQIQARMNTQISDIEKIPLCDMVVDNSGTQRTLLKQAEFLISRLDSIRKRDTMPFYS